MTTALERIDELLLDEAVVGLAETEKTELENLLSEYAGVDRFAYESAASIFFVGALATPDEAMPAELRERLCRVADKL